jgi:hypothetical protein
MRLHPSVIALLAIVIIPLAGCDAKYRNVSDDLVGGSCELLAPLRAHGVSKVLQREKETDYISIWNPGFTGPEVTFVVPLQPGTQMRVLSARECSNCPFDALLEYQVEIFPEPTEFAGKPAFVRAGALSAPGARCSGPVRPNNSFKPKPLRGSA